MAESAYWKRFWRRRISRRALLGAGAVTALGAGAAAVVGCGGSNDSGNGATPGDGATPGPDGNLTPVQGGTITQGQSINTLGIDPHIDLTGLGFDVLMYTYLYSWNRFTEEAVTNNFVESMEIPDPLHFNFTLRKGVMTWPAPYGGPAADQELTSADCKASFERRGTALTAPDKRFPERFLKGGSLDTPDPYQFNIVLDRPFVPALREMANPTWAIVPAKVIDKYPNLGQIAFGSGPFMLEEFRGSERIVLIRHPNYFLNPKPWLDSIRTIVITENSSLLAAFKSGQHDINGAILTRSTAQDLIDDDNFVVASAPSLFYPVIHIKQRPPWNDPRLSEALDLAINRDEIITVIQDGEGNYNGPIQWPQFKWALPQDELRAFYRFDPERAKSLLAEAGHPEVTVKMKAPELTGPSIFGDIAQLIQNQVKDVGINIELDFVELGAFIGNVILPGNFDLAFFPNLPYDEPDRPLSFYHSKGVTGSGNWTNYTNPELDKLIDAQAEEFDEAKRIEIVMEAQRMILPEHRPQLTLTGGTAYAASWKHVHFGAQGPQGFGGGFEPPPEGVEYGPFGTEIWTEKV